MSLFLTVLFHLVPKKITMQIGQKLDMRKEDSCPGTQEWEASEDCE